MGQMLAPRRLLGAEPPSAPPSELLHTKMWLVPNDLGWWGNTQGIARLGGKRRAVKGPVKILTLMTP